MVPPPKQQIRDVQIRENAAVPTSKLFAITSSGSSVQALQDRVVEAEAVLAQDRVVVLAVEVALDQDLGLWGVASVYHLNPLESAACRLCTF